MSQQQQQVVVLDPGHFRCSICLDLIKVPVALHCGHSYCMHCVECQWDQQRPYRCALCRESCTPRPVLRMNYMLAEVVKKLRDPGGQPSSPSAVSAVPSQCGRSEQRVVALDPGRFCCSMCLDLLKEPVALYCGHSYCGGCIERQWSQQRAYSCFRCGAYSCVQCEESFRPTPVPRKNFMLAEVVEKLRNPGGQPSAASAVSAVSSQTRQVLLQYSYPLSLDVNTLNNYLSLSGENRKVTRTQQHQHYPNLRFKERFKHYHQVLGRESLPERCYWEVECRGQWVHIAVSYIDINRKEHNLSAFGCNDKSWNLSVSCHEGYRFRHNNVMTKVSGPLSSRVAVYVDHKAGTLSFYCVSDTVTLLHTVQTTFTQPLYPGIRLPHRCGDAAEVCKIW